jgi:hypothetical protein
MEKRESWANGLPSHAFAAAMYFRRMLLEHPASPWNDRAQDAFDCLCDAVRLERAKAEMAERRLGIVLKMVSRAIMVVFSATLIGAIVGAALFMSGCAPTHAEAPCVLDAALDDAGPMELRFENGDDPWGETCDSVLAFTGLFDGAPMPEHCEVLEEPVLGACSVAMAYRCPWLAGDGGHVDVDVFMAGGELEESGVGFARIRWFDASGAFVCSAPYTATLERRTAL